MRSIITAAAVVLALAGNAAAQSADWEEQRRNSLTPSFGDMVRGVASGFWAHIRGLDQAGERAGNSRCNCSVGKADRAR